MEGLAHVYRFSYSEQKLCHRSVQLLNNTIFSINTIVQEADAVRMGVLNTNNE